MFDGRLDVWRVVGETPETDRAIYAQRAKPAAQILLVEGFKRPVGYRVTRSMSCPRNACCKACRYTWVVALVNEHSA